MNVQKILLRMSNQTHFIRQFLFLLFLSFSISGFSQSNESKLDSVIRIVADLEGQEKFKTYYKLVAILDQQYDKRAIKLADEGYTHFLTLENPNEDTWTKAANFPYAQAGFALHDDNYKRVLEKCDVLSEHAQKMEALGYKAPIMRSNADFYRAIVYSKQEKNELALETALRAISNFENPDTIVWAIPIFSFIGNRYGQMNKIANAQYYFKKTINYYQKIVDEGKRNPKPNSETEREYYETSLGRAFYNRGEMFSENKMFEQAIPDYQAATNYIKNPSTYTRILAICGLNNAYTEAGRFSEAYNNLKEFEPSFVDSLIDADTKLFYYRVLAKASEGMGKYQEANKYLRIYSSQKDSIASLTYDKDLADLQTKYETKVSENKIAQLQISNDSKKNQNRLLWLLVGGLSLLVGGIYYQTTQRKKFADQILKKDKEVLDLKENFFINITHQLRTPLSLIIAPLKEVQNSNIDTKTKLKVEQALKNSGRLLELFNQLLDWNKMEAHALKLSMKKAEIVESLQSILERYKELADQKKITFKNELPNAPVYGEMDFDKLEKVLSNLVSNAIKFTPIGGAVTVRAKIEKGNLHVEVEDNGIGIKESDIDKVFEKYYQVGDSSDGFGFGLTFANELTKLMGGNLSAKSTSNVKTTFELAIPFTRLDQLPKAVQTTQQVTLPNPIFADSSLSLLVVEDNIELNNYLSSFFESKYTVLSALSKKEALELAYSYAPDIILCDVMLPDGTGFQILEELKNNASTNHIPILMLTAKTDEKYRKEGWAKGADGYLHKPFDPEELNAVIYNLLVNRKKVHEKFSVLTEQFLSDKTPEVQDPFMENLLTLMNDNIGNEYYSIDDLAANFPMNRTHFYQKVKAVSGSTPKTLFRELRLRKANHMIKAGTSPKEAALKTGFVSLSHFSRSYKNYFKENPSETLRS